MQMRLMNAYDLFRRRSCWGRGSYRIQISIYALVSVGHVAIEEFFSLFLLLSHHLVQHQHASRVARLRPEGEAG